MGLEWWEYYEINHNVNNLRKQIEDLEKEIKHLREELEKIKKKKRPFLSWFEK